jgi:hypothetical protein
MSEANSLSKTLKIRPFAPDFVGPLKHKNEYSFVQINSECDSS